MTTPVETPIDATILSIETAIVLLFIIALVFSIIDVVREAMK